MADGVPKLTLDWHRTTVPKIGGSWTPTDSVASDRNLIVIVLDDPPQLHAQHGGHYAFDRTSYDFTQDSDRTAGTGDPDHLYPYTPRINTLAAAGVTFTEFRAMPVCSPFRASFMTGVYPFRHGLGSVTKQRYGPIEFGDPGFVYTTLPALLESAGVKTYLGGKIHLSIPEDENFEEEDGTELVPAHAGIGYGVIPRLGFTSYDAWLRNLNQNQGAGSPGSGGDYFWHQITSGTYDIDGNATAGPTTGSIIGATGTEVAADYAPKHQIDNTLTWIAAQTTRWFAYLPMHNTHSPFTNLPPSDDRYTPEYVDGGGTPSETWYAQMSLMESVDYQIGRLIDGMSAATRAKTTICIVGDNGVDTTYWNAHDPGQTIQKDFGTNWNAMITEYDTSATQLKASVKDSGVRSIMIWSGTDVNTAGRTSDALVNCTDFLPTIQEFFSDSFLGEVAGHEGESFMPIIETTTVTQQLHPRQATFHEIFRPLGVPPATLPHADYPTTSKMERGYIARLEDQGLGTAGDGLWSLVRIYTTGVDQYTDTLYQITDGAGVAVDPFQLTSLTVTLPANIAQYKALSEALNILLASDPPNAGNYYLPIVGIHNEAAEIVLTSADKVAILDLTGTEALIDTSGNNLPITGITGLTTDTIDLGTN